MKARRTFTLDADVDAILADIATGQSSASAYLEDLVRDAERQWRGAYDVLRQLGWTRNELSAGFEALNGFGLLDEIGTHPATWAAVELADADRLNGLAAKHDVDPARWEELCRRIGTEEAEARALVSLAAEFWRMNPRVERLIS